MLTYKKIKRAFAVSDDMEVDSIVDVALSEAEEKFGEFLSTAMEAQDR